MLLMQSYFSIKKNQRFMGLFFVSTFFQPVLWFVTYYLEMAPKIHNNLKILQIGP